MIRISHSYGNRMRREFGPLFVLLASDDGSYIANEVFVIAGGMPMPG